ncbi:MAG: peptide-methionine (S)-S-oxide reductase MsrA [Nanoarchaeota archaeon]|nr:peptide-methionine (S)-S-oxide reductase MsrA [Nanoarchaeota archaeon]
MIATFAAGCFWHVELEFSKVKGVKSTTVGYMGGTKDKPTYKDVCSDTSGHAEVCQVEYDPKKVSYEKLLDLFWKMHNPTTMNRQGLDIGTQYRSAIFYHNEPQRKKAVASLKKEQKKHIKKIVTEIIEASDFWKAEDYHQDYLKKKGLKTCGI